MKTLTLILSFIGCTMFAQTTDKSLVGVWSRCGTFDLTKELTFQKTQPYDFITSCTQEPCNGVWLVFEEYRLKLTTST